MRLARAVSWGTVNAAHTGAVKAAGGQDMTMEDWVLAYGLSFGAEGVGALRQLITGRYKVQFRGPVPGEKPTFAPPEARALVAAQKLQARPELKLDPGPETTAALTTTFSQTMAGGRSIAPQAGQHYPTHSPPYVAEIRTITETARRPEVVRIHGVPSSSSDRSPDLVVFVEQNGAVVPTRIEATTATGVPAGYQPWGPVANRPTTVGTIVSAVKRKLKSTPTEPNQLTVPLTLADGTVVPPGGTLAIHLPS